MPSSRHALATRRAISPRFAIRTFSNTAPLLLRRRLEIHQHLLELDPLAVLDDDLGDLARGVRLDLVHQLHRLDDRHRLAGVDRVADLHVRVGARLRGAVEGADERRLDRVAAVQLGGRGAVLGAGRRRRGHGYAGRDAALDLDARVAGLDGESLHRAALEALDQLARLLPNRVDQLLVG